MQDTNAGTLLLFEPWTVISTVNAIFHSVSVFGVVLLNPVDWTCLNPTVLCIVDFTVYLSSLIKQEKCSIYSLTLFSEIFMGQETLVNSCFLSTLSLSHLHLFR